MTTSNCYQVNIFRRLNLSVYKQDPTVPCKYFFLNKIRSGQNLQNLWKQISYLTWNENQWKSNQWKSINGPRVLEVNPPHFSVFIFFFSCSLSISAPWIQRPLPFLCPLYQESSPWVTCICIISLLQDLIQMHHLNNTFIYLYLYCLYLQCHLNCCIPLLGLEPPKIAWARIWELGAKWVFHPKLSKGRTREKWKRKGGKDQQVYAIQPAASM